MNKNRTTHIITIVSLAVFIVLGLATSTTPAVNTGNSSGGQAGDSNTDAPFFTGDGGKGMKLAVLEPSVNGLTDDEKKWMPSTIQGSITGDFNRFSAMTIIDRQNFEKILAEQTLSTSGYFSDEDFLRIGHLINTQYILVGSVTRTATAYMLELSVTNAETGERKASYPPTQVSPLGLENLTAVKEATAALLEQLGVQLTARGQEELRKAPDTATVQAEMALARGISAQRQGTEVAALSYYFQAAALNPVLLEAANRSSILNANISSGNIGEDVRNDIIWRRNWIQRLTEAEQSFDQFNKSESLLYTLFYKSDEIQRGAVNYQNETVTLSIETYLRPSHTWGRTVGVPMLRTLRAVYDGLQATQRAGDWGLQGWPRQGVTNLNSFSRRSNSFTIVIELLNEQNQVISRQNLRADGWWEYTYSQGAPSGVNISNDVKNTVNFTVKADDITDKLTISIASVNGVDAETAARNRVLQIRAVTKSQYDIFTHWNSVYDFALGEIRGLRPQNGVTSATVNGKRFELYIPPTIWGDPVASIGREAFNRKFTSQSNTGTTLNYLQSVYLPNNVTYIGESAFVYIHRYFSNGNWHETAYRPPLISIGADVTMENNSFDVESTLTKFAQSYKANNMKAGIYTLTTNSDMRWIWRYSAR